MVYGFHILINDTVYRLPTKNIFVSTVIEVATSRQSRMIGKVKKGKLTFSQGGYLYDFFPIKRYAHTKT